VLYGVLKEGLFWAALGRPSEVMPFLRGKLLSNGVSGARVEYLSYLLDDLEGFYRRVSWKGSLEERDWKALRSFHRDILLAIR